MDANSYASLAYADAYHLDRGTITWVGSIALRQAALVRATDYIDKRFGQIFLGYRQSSSQGLEWPRLGAYDRDDLPLNGIPVNLQKATVEYALRALSGDALTDLAPDPEDSDAAGTVISKKERVGPIEEYTSYGTSSSRSGVSGLVSVANIPEYPAADLMLAKLTRSSNNRRIVRG